MPSARCSRARAGASPTASRRATCIWCSAPAADGKPVRFRVRIDGQPPLADHGFDTDAQGVGTVDAQRLYQLVRQQQGARERLFEIEFLDPGAQAHAFTFG